MVLILTNVDDLQLLSIASHSTYHDKYEGYSGTHGRGILQQAGQTGAGHPNDKDSLEAHGRVSQIEVDQLQHVHHDAVEVPEKRSPFRTEVYEMYYFHLLENLVTEDIVPEGYGLLPGELDDKDIEMVEVLQFGLRGTKSIAISLTEPIWAAREKLWAQALDLLYVFDAAGHCLASLL
ncbi:hypothetical protein PAXRUDRAFT_36718 [Paxillus rubicundulus Ve08.2h10]|uniref:Uncharacterized protein n=1 Tax=Paxillus rubicundulus Ve08.2h10 TaxID=930991 RepID=A0A0D0DBG7_9AGAM|nr:hypothetical protein PAXRUDRAFT_36718 [Paxillus rubicundulus Ve08.2h10]